MLCAVGQPLDCTEVLQFQISLKLQQLTQDWPLLPLKSTPFSNAGGTLLYV